MGNLAQYSADYPGVLVKTVEEEFDNKPLCLFLQGASGDIDTYYTNVSAENDPVRWMDWSGKRLGSAAAATARKVETSESADSGLEFVEDVIPFRWRWAEGKFEEVMRRENPASLLEFYMPEIKNELLLRMTTIVIDKRIALMSMPGEAFVEFQMNWRDRCPIEHSLFLGCANGFFSYFPTIRAAVEGGHGGGLWTRVEVGAGERMVDRAVVRTYEMLGKLTPTPQPIKLWRSSI
jgi:neutral ceramidase